jgi:hypothetical protein
MPATLVLSRNDPASARITDWMTRNRVANIAAVRYVEDLKPGELNWNATAATPQLLIQQNGAWVWIKGEDAIRQALWAVFTRKPKIIAYVSSTCGACQRMLGFLAASPRLLADTDIRDIDKNPRYVIEMHDLKAFATPTVVENTPQGVKVLQGPSAVMRVIELA